MRIGQIASATIAQPLKRTAMPIKNVVMLCTAAPGGMSQVVENLRQSGLFERYPVRVIWTHDRGGTGLRIGMFLRSFALFAIMLVTGRVALVHAHVAMRGSFWRKSLFIALAWFFRRPTVLHLHGSQFVEFYERECGSLGKFAVRFVFERVDAVIVLSEQWRTFVRGLAPAAQVITMHNFVNASQLSDEMRNSVGRRSTDTILFLGEIGKRKGIYDLLHALPRVIDVVPGARLIAGGTGELEQVRQCAKDLNVDGRVHLPGWVSGHEKVRLLSEAAVYALPSYNEGLPVSILEAMACGLPVISTPVGGIPEAIRDGQEGFLVAPGAIDELSSRIIQLLLDSRLRREMGANAKRRLQTNFSATSTVNSIVALYEKCGIGKPP